jgi:hypothetical protein
MESLSCTPNHLDNKMLMFRAEGSSTIAVHLARYVCSRPPCMRRDEWRTPRRLDSNKDNALRPLSRGGLIVALSQAG